MRLKGECGDIAACTGRKRFSINFPLAFMGCLLLVAGVPIPAMAATGDGSNWPQWRGPGGSGVSEEKYLPLEWSETKNIQWKTAIPSRGGEAGGKESVSRVRETVSAEAVEPPVLVADDDASGSQCRRGGYGGAGFELPKFGPIGKVEDVEASIA